MATMTQVEEARVRLAYLLRAMLRRVDKRKIGEKRYRNLGAEMTDYLRAAAVAARSTMQFVTLVAARFEVELSEGTYEGADGEERERRAVAAFLPESLAGDLPGHLHDGCRVVPWAVIAQHTPLDAVRLVVHEGAAFFVTFAQATPSEHDAGYFRTVEETKGRRWAGVLPGEQMQSPRQHRAVFVVVDPLAHGADDKAGNVVLFRRQPQVDPWTGQHALVPFYSGNAVKGQWRDLFFSRMLRAVGLTPETDLSPRRAQELFSGGTIESGADTATVRLDVRRRARKTVPAVDLLGGCVDQQILSGLLRVNDVTLFCRENAWKLYRTFAPKDAAGAPITYEEFAQSLLPADDLTLLRLGVRQAHRDLPGGDLSAKEGGAQMLYNTEAIKPGARLFHAFSLASLSSVSSLAKSCMADLLADFCETGHLGAKTSSGFGRVSTMGYFPAENADPLSSPDEYLAYLDSHRAEIVDWVLADQKEPADLEAAKKKPTRAKKGAAGEVATP